MKHTLTSPKDVSVMLKAKGITLSHSLGQNFLVNHSIIERILRLAEVSCADNILEVGPGIGALTVPLLESGAKVTSIEKDSRLKTLLLQNTEFAKDRFTLIEGDALDFVSCRHSMKTSCGSASEKMAFDMEDACHCTAHNIDESKSCEFGIERCDKLVANLPYNIAATLVLDCFQQISSLKSATVMVQKEVAQRMRAEVGSKNYGAYTVKLRLLAEVQGSFFVGRNNFLPAPRVDSAVIRLNRNDRNLPEDVLRCACIAADASFYNRRKTILNSCKAYFSASSNNTQNWLESCDVDPKVRGEKLDVEDFINLGRNINMLINS